MCYKLGIGNKIKDGAVNKVLGDSRVAAQVQKNTEKLLRGKQKETFLIVREAVKDLLNNKYEDFIKTAVMEIMDELKSDCKKIILSRVLNDEQAIKKDSKQ